MLPKKRPKWQDIICFQQRPTNNTVPFFWEKIQFKRKRSKKQCHKCHIFSTRMSQFAFLKQNPLFCVPEKSESQEQMNSTHYFLTLLVPKNQRKKVLIHVLKLEN